MRLGVGLLRRSSLPTLPPSDTRALAATITGSPSASSRSSSCRAGNSSSSIAIPPQPIIVETQELVPYSQAMILCIESTDPSNIMARKLERVEVRITYKKGQRFLQILCLGHDDHDDEQYDEMASVGSTDSFVSEQESSRASSGVPPEEPSFLEQLARTVLDPCHCQTFLKPALRKEPKSTDYIDSRSVSFDKVDIKEFPMTLGDHPSAASGPPVALDWEKVERERCVALDEYEASRSPRRSRKQLKLSLRDRKGILQRQFSADEVNKAWQEARAIREQRRETIQRGMMMMLMDDMVETANRKVAKMGDSFSSMILW